LARIGTFNDEDFSKHCYDAARIKEALGGSFEE